MSKIQVLPPHVADLIAAGEVVERPGSVVKELMENSIDAGATVLTVEIKNGGMTYIRVTDNGCGMSSEDAQTAFLRHATSKLKNERGLEAISTLGFRGEALAAIASVSRVTLKTREKDSPEGTEVRLEAGEITDVSPSGCAYGTTMIVENLFYNTPARLKFMKNDRAEGLAVTGAVLKEALSHPEVSVRYIRDGKEECHTAGDGRPASCLYTLFGNDVFSGMLPAETDMDGVKVSGFVSSPGSARGNRTHQFFFVNNRYVKSKTLQAALEQAYKNSLFTGKYPACVLYITIPPGEVDVNVHPAKTEVRFLREKAVFDGVYYAALAALDRQHDRGELSLPEEKPPVMKGRVSVPSGGFKTVSAESYRSGGGMRPVSVERGFFRRPAVRDYSVPYTVTPKKPMPEPEPEEQASFLPEAPKWRIIGEALKTYIIVEVQDGIVLIDKHAAHERMIFDRLKAAGDKPMTQILLAPVIFPLSPEDMDVLTENTDFFRELGFEAEEFSSGRAAVREAPEDVDAADIPETVTEICEKLRSGKTADAATRRDEALHTIACKAAIKAGKRSETPEMQVIVESVMHDEVRYCPHGRPVAMDITKAQIDKGFKRI